MTDYIANQVLAMSDCVQIKFSQEWLNSKQYSRFESGVVVLQKIPGGLSSSGCVSNNTQWFSQEWLPFN